MGALAHNPKIEGKAVMQNIESCEQTRETTALLKILALGIRQVEEDKVQPVADVIKGLRERGKAG